MKQHCFSYINIDFFKAMRLKKMHFVKKMSFFSHIDGYFGKAEALL